MSKSAANPRHAIGILDAPGAILKKLKSAKTDSRTAVDGASTTRSSPLHSDGEVGVFAGRGGAPVPDRSSSPAISPAITAVPLALAHLGASSSTDPDGSAASPARTRPLQRTGEVGTPFGRSFDVKTLSTEERCDES